MANPVSFDTQITDTYETRILTLLQDLPQFCFDYISSMTEKKAASTRYANLQHIRIYLLFIRSCIPPFLTADLKHMNYKTLDAIQAEDIDQFLIYLDEYTLDGRCYHSSPGYKKNIMISVSAMYRYFIRRRILKTNPFDAVALPETNSKETAVFSSREIAALLWEVKNGSYLTPGEKLYHERIRYRDTAIVTLLLTSDLLISELAGLDIQDLNIISNGPDAGSALQYKAVIRGRREREVLLSEKCSLAIRDYLREERSSLSGEEENTEQALFLSLKHKRMAVNSIELMIRRYAKNVLPHKKVTPRSLRKTSV